MPCEVADPNKWFLAERQNPNSDLSIYTSGNDVTALIDGAAYFREACDVVSSTERGDAICYAGWRLDCGLELAPGDKASRIDRVLTEAHRRGVNVRVMLSNHLTQRNTRIHRRLRTAGVPCVMDARYPRFGSAHQKLLIISRKGILTAFCGGIDIAHGRWDHPTHPSGGWHDVQCSIRGSACLDLYKTFRERWNDPRHPGKKERPPPPLEDPLLGASKVGGHHVQVLRTYSCKPGYPFAPRGEFTARRACLKAIGLAQRYIYIEDQYFVSREIADALEIALRARPNLQVIVVVPEAPSIFLRPFVRRQAMLVDQLTNVAADRFAIYHLRNRSQANPGGQIYVHSKLMIVDDIWAEIGSVNCNRRSMTHDSELAVAVVDEMMEGQACRFARDLRLKLWAEHLGLNPTDDSILDPWEGFRMWRARSGLSDVPAVDHASVSSRSNPGLKLMWRAIDWLAWEMVDPTGLCPEEANIPP